MDAENVVRVSAKTGLGVTELLEAIIGRVPPPNGDPDSQLQAMVFDSHYDAYRGVITYVRVMNGTVEKGQKIRFLRGGTIHEVLELGQFVPQPVPCQRLGAGQVGYLICNIKSLDLVHIGDTVSVPGERAAEVLPGYQEPIRMVYGNHFRPMPAVDRYGGIIAENKILVCTERARQRPISIGSTRIQVVHISIDSYFPEMC